MNTAKTSPGIFEDLYSRPWQRVCRLRSSGTMGGKAFFTHPYILGAPAKRTAAQRTVPRFLFRGALPLRLSPTNINFSAADELNGRSQKLGYRTPEEPIRCLSLMLIR